jgi:hypothetical protein
MKVAVTPEVRLRAEELFSPADAAVACAELAAADLPLIGSNGETVHFCVLHLAQGNLAALREHLKSAMIDWRDIVVAARGY